LPRSPSARNKERIASASRSAVERRRELVSAASVSLQLIGDALFDAISDAAPAARSHSRRSESRGLELGKAWIELLAATETPPSPRGSPELPFNVISYSEIILETPHDLFGYDGRSHSLWFCDAREAGRYQWFETAFMISPLVPRTSKLRPFGLTPGPEAKMALGRSVAEFQLAWPLEPVDIGDLDEFIDRWATWFALGAEGRLRGPSQMPERATPANWRQK
jgi:eukaryotic-like serine/threonine-protein kinase